MGRKMLTRMLCMALIASTLTTTGCFGRFALVRGIYTWNDGVSGNKFVKWLVFIGLTVIPVYALGGLADAFIFNALEFWTGSNPMASRETPETRVVALNAHESMRMTHYGDALEVQVYRGETLSLAFTFVGEDNGMAMLDASGQVVARVRDIEGALQVVNALGEELAAVPGAQAAQVARAYESQGAEAAVSVARQSLADAQPSVALR